ncbi:MAG: hypothetical protein DWQ09_01710 [Proteobacteria bacterium]|nr:MAG: hypothetical protein DWQ09_01710 [Pseudomonadota bacterium]QKK10294.1 MAG: hypothetical protein HND59_00385 [Pseudomonadota bacterium]
MDDIPIPLNREKSPFLRQVRAVIRERGLACKTQKTYLNWIRKFICFHDKKHPVDLGEQQVSKFLSDLETSGSVPDCFRFRNCWGTPTSQPPRYIHM